MHPADEYARLKSEIRALDARARMLRARFLTGEAPLKSNAVEVKVRRQRRRVFLRDKVPLAILEDPGMWAQEERAVVTVAPCAPDAAPTPHTPHMPRLPEEEAFEVIDRW